MDYENVIEEEFRSSLTSMVIPGYYSSFVYFFKQHPPPEERNKNENNIHIKVLAEKKKNL